ncbi:MAG: GNAT family N-acetyltransferase [Thermomicrobiales bacterium]|nr:GNAT family N-acetyltransferase [Thermomicrobiales bacterium]
MDSPYPALIAVPDAVESERLRLRPLRGTDAEPMLAAIEASRADLELWLGWPRRVTTLDATRDLCLRAAARWTLREELRYGVFSARDETLLGVVSLHDPDWTVRSFDLGYWLRSSAVGHGYAQEAVQLLTVVAFETLQAHRVAIRCDPRNVRSRRVAEAVGYPFEGHLRNFALNPQGQMRDALIFAAIPADYERLRGAWRHTITETQSEAGWSLRVV